MPTLTEDEVNCPHCGETVLANATTEYLDEMLCVVCYDDALDASPCYFCGEHNKHDDMTMIQDDEFMCLDCSHDHTECIDCEVYVPMDECAYVSEWRRDGPVCEDCYEDNYFYCDNCMEHMSIGNYGGEGMCSDCYEDSEYCDCGECGGGAQGIRPWGDAPNLRFNDVPFIGPIKSTQAYMQTPDHYSAKIGKYYLGMEIEVEETEAHVIGEFVSMHEDFMWASTDATLDEGYEIITHPTTYAAWMNEFPWAAWERDLHGNVPAQENYSSNGIHIHVSRTAFADAKGTPMASHLFKFMQFIRINEAAIQMLSERTGGSYCEWNQVRDARDGMNDAKTATSTRNYERYRPVNTQNRATIELRFFDGRTDPVFMKRALGFTASLVEFTRHGKAHDARTWEAYVTYVSDHADLYPDLHSYLVDNRRRLVFNAMTSEYRYTDEVLPSIRARKDRERREVIEERNRQTRIAREREEVVSSIDNVCTCPGCESYRERERREAAAQRYGFIRDYMDGNFHVNVYATELGERHEYAHVSTDLMGEHQFTVNTPPTHSISRTHPADGSAQSLTMTVAN